MNSLYLPYYDGICSILSDEWQPYISGRTLAQQDALFAQGRTSPGKIVTDARGGESGHNYYCATDWTKWLDKKPIWLTRDAPEWNEYLNACQKVGLKCGADWGDYYHNELRLNCSWKKINSIRLKNGDDSAQKAIEENMANSA